MGDAVTVERLGVMSTDRVLTRTIRIPSIGFSNLVIRELADAARWSGASPRSTLRFSVQDLAYAGFSLRSDTLAPIAISSDGRVRVGQAHELLPFGKDLERRLRAAERPGKRRSGSKPFRDSKADSKRHGAQPGHKELDRALREASRDRSERLT
jgi:hypothetical protein